MVNCSTCAAPALLAMSCLPHCCARPAIPAPCLGKPWTRLLHSALEIALREGLDEQAGRAFANLYATYCAQRRYADGEPSYLAGIAYCDEHDLTTWASSLRGERTSALEKTGRWERDEIAEPRRRQIDGDWAGAADLWTEIGCPYEAAMALLDAADEQALRRALTLT